MSRLRLRLAVLALVVAAAAPGFARDLTPIERTALEARVGSFNDAMQGKRMADVISVLPPRFVEHLAGQAKVTPDQLRQLIVEQMGKALEQVKIFSFGMDLAAAQKKELSDGTPYLLLPTVTVMDAGTGKIEVKSDTLALLDGGAWYLLDLADPGRAVLFGLVYPEYKGVEFGGKSMKAVP